VFSFVFWVRLKLDFARFGGTYARNSRHFHQTLDRTTLGIRAEMKTDCESGGISAIHIVPCATNDRM
jgi:hypothetical protein